uniref:Uncharacterized protein n=1 Tax=Papio anubis TaxID=9555 RepID=A0A8I5NAN2_PAPAN
MTPGTQSPFFLLLILTVLTVVTGSGHTNSTLGGEKETSTTQRSSMPISTKNAIPAPTTTNSCRETFLHCFCRFINKGIFWASPILCSGCLSVPPKELQAAGHVSRPGCLPSYERVPHLPHPWALCARWWYQS